METRATNPWLKFIPVFIAVFCTIMVIPKSTKRFTTEASKPKEQAWPIQSTENKNDKLKCMEGKYVIWQPHYSGLGSNLVIGLGNAAKYAAYAQRELIIGMPAPGWMYHHWSQWLASADLATSDDDYSQPLDQPL